MLKEEETLLQKTVAERIKYLRKKAGYTSQETFAYDSEIPRALYGKYEKGANLTLVSLYRILQAHKITFEEFFSEGFESLPIGKKESK